MRIFWLSQENTTPGGRIQKVHNQLSTLLIQQSRQKTLLNLLLEEALLYCNNIAWCYRAIQLFFTLFLIAITIANHHD